MQQSGVGVEKKNTVLASEKRLYKKDQTVKTGVIYETSTLVRVVSEDCEGTRLPNRKGDRNRKTGESFL